MELRVLQLHYQDWTCKPRAERLGTKSDPKSVMPEHKSDSEPATSEQKSGLEPAMLEEM